MRQQKQTDSVYATKPHQWRIQSFSTRQQINFSHLFLKPPSKNEKASLESTNWCLMSFVKSHQRV